MEHKIIQDGMTFDDVLLVPEFSRVTPEKAVTTTRLTRNIRLNIPIVSAPMDTVTEAALAIALRRWWRSMPQIPKGDIIVTLDGGVRMAATWGKALQRTDSVLRQWPTATASLLILTVALGAAVLVR